MFLLSASRSTHSEMNHISWLVHRFLKTHSPLGDCTEPNSFPSKVTIFTSFFSLLWARFTEMFLSTASCFNLLWAKSYLMDCFWLYKDIQCFGAIPLNPTHSLAVSRSHIMFPLVLTLASCFSLLLALLRSMEVFLMSPCIRFRRCTSCSTCRASPRLCTTYTTTAIEILSPTDHRHNIKWE